MNSVITIEKRNATLGDVALLMIVQFAYPYPLRKDDIIAKVLRMRSFFPFLIFDELTDRAQAW